MTGDREIGTGDMLSWFDLFCLKGDWSCVSAKKNADSDDKGKVMVAADKREVNVLLI